MPAKRKRTPRTFDDAIQWLRGEARDLVKLSNGYPAGHIVGEDMLLDAAACNRAAGLLGNVKGRVERAAHLGKTRGKAK